MWKTKSDRKETFFEFTNWTKGSYQQLGPQGMMALVDLPDWLLRSINWTNSLAINLPISAES